MRNSLLPAFFVHLLLCSMLFGAKQHFLQELVRLGNPGFRLPGEVDGLCFSRDSKRLAGWTRATRSTAASLRIWSVPEGNELFRSSEQDITYAYFSDDGQRFFAGGNYSIAVYDVSSATPIITLNKLDTNEHLSKMSKDGQYLLVGTMLDKDVKEGRTEDLLLLRCFEVESSSELFRQTYPYGQCLSLEFAPNCKEFVFVQSQKLSFKECQRGNDVATPLAISLKEIPYGQLRPIVEFSRSGKYLLCADCPRRLDDNSDLLKDETARAYLMDGYTHKQLNELKQPGGAFSAGFNELETEVLLSTPKGIHAFDVSSGQKKWSWQGNCDGSQQSRIASYSYRAREWLLFKANFNKRIVVEGNEDKNSALLTILPKGDTSKNKSHFLANSCKLRSLAISPNGSHVAIGDENNIVSLFDGHTGKKCAAPDGHFGLVSAISLSKKNDYTVTGSSDGTIRLWKADGVQVGNVGRHRAPIVALAFSPAGDEIVSVCMQGLVRRWSVPNVAPFGATQLTDGIQEAAMVASKGVLAIVDRQGIISVYNELFDEHKHTKLKVVRRLDQAKGYSINDLHLCSAAATITAVGKKSPLFVWRPKVSWPVSMLECAIRERRCALSPSGMTLACASESPLLFFNDPYTGRVLHISRNEIKFPFLHFICDARLLCVGAGGRARILTIARYPERRFTKAIEIKSLATFNLDICAPASIYGTPNGRLIAFGLHDSTAVVYAINSKPSMKAKK